MATAKHNRGKKREITKKSYFFHCTKGKTIAGVTYKTPFDDAIKKLHSEHKDSGTNVPESFFEYIACEKLEINPLELKDLGYETASYHIAWIDGKNLAEWINQQEN